MRNKGTSSKRLSPIDTRLFQYQVEAADLAVYNGGCAGLFMEMGTGKTRTALEIARRLECGRILIVSPLSAVGVWGREASIFWPGLSMLNATNGTVNARSKAIAQVDQPSPRAVIVGYESYWREPLRSIILKWEPDIVIYDEAHRLAGRGTKQSRFASRLADVVRYRLALTGTPMKNGPEDLFALFRAIKPDVFGTRWADFEHHYCVKGGYLGYEIVGYRNVAEFKQLLAANSFRLRKVDALDLPDQVDVHVPVKLGEKASKIYERLRKQAIAEVEGVLRGEAAQGVTLARTVLTNILRLQQITGGWAKLEDGRTVDFSDEKERVLVDLVNDAVLQSGHVVVFARFRHDIDRVCEALEEHQLVYRIDGTVPHSERDVRLVEFVRESEAVLVMQVAVALGIDLSASNVAIFYGLDYSLVNYLQSRDRLHRIGQTRKVTYYHLLASKTIDEKVFKVLQRKEELSKRILDGERARKMFE